MTAFDGDPRLNAARPDLADARLRGQVAAAEFFEGRPARAKAPVTGVHIRPDFESPRETEILFGETARIFEIADGWAWLQMDRDDYVGYAKAIGFDIGDATGDGSTDAGPTHRVGVRETLVFASNDVRSMRNMNLPRNAQVSCRAPSGLLTELTTGGWIVTAHLAELGVMAEDFVTVAESYVGAPYLWGGCSPSGIDCSALVQMACLAAGLPCMRDSDMQAATLGTPVDPGEANGRLQRGDLVFWKGHVGIMQDGEHLLHANGTHMTTLSERLDVVAARTEATYGRKITCVRRLPALSGKA